MNIWKSSGPIWDIKIWPVKVPDSVLSGQDNFSNGQNRENPTEWWDFCTYKRNKAAVMVTHDERMLDLADKIYKMEDGKLM